jgi:hypothetical protein
MDRQKEIPVITQGPKSTPAELVVRGAGGLYRLPEAVEFLGLIVQKDRWPVRLHFQLASGEKLEIPLSQAAFARLADQIGPHIRAN